MKNLNDRCLDDRVADKPVRITDQAGVYRIGSYGEISPPGRRQRAYVFDGFDRCRGYVTRKVACALIARAK